MLFVDDIKTLSNVELVTLIVGGRRTARALLRNSEGSLFRLLCCNDTGRKCTEAENQYAARAMPRLQAAVELAARAVQETLTQRDCLSSPLAVRAFLKQRLAGLAHEVFVVLLLDAQNRLIHFEELFRGTLTQTAVYPREVIKLVLEHNAAAVVFAHNHPSGSCEPSRADESLTQTLKHALALVDVRVLDHFIVAGTNTVSFAERGLL